MALLEPEKERMRHIRNVKMLFQMRRCVGKMLKMIFEVQAVENAVFEGSKNLGPRRFVRFRLAEWYRHEWLLYMFSNILKASLPTEFYKFLLRNRSYSDDDKFFDILRQLDIVREKERLLYNISDSGCSQKCSNCVNRSPSQVSFYS